MRIIALFGMLLIAAQSGAAQQKLTLEAARLLARKNNATLQIAKETLYQAESLIDRAWVMVKPQITVTGTYTRHDKEVIFKNASKVFLFGPDNCSGLDYCINPDFLANPVLPDLVLQRLNSFGMLATVNQPIFAPRAYTAIKNAYEAYELAKLNEQNVAQYVLHSVEVAYYAALTAQKILDSAKKAVTVRKEHFKVARAKHEVGEQPKITVLRAAIDLSQAEQDRKQAEISLELAKEAISLLIGGKSKFRLVRPTPHTRPKMGLDKFIQKALGTRRDLRAAKLNLSIVQRNKRDAYYRFLPTLSLSGMYRLSDVEGFLGENQLWNVSLALTLPLYDGGLRYALIDEAQSKIRQAEIDIKAKQDSIRSEIKQLWLKMEMAETNLKKAQRTLELAQEQAELTKTSFDAGAVTGLEVMDANHLLYLSEVNIAQLELSHQLAIISLNAAIRMYIPGSVTSSITPVTNTTSPAASGRTLAPGSNAAGFDSGIINTLY